MSRIVMADDSVFVDPVNHSLRPMLGREKVASHRWPRQRWLIEEGDLRVHKYSDCDVKVTFADNGFSAYAVPLHIPGLDTALVAVRKEYYARQEFDGSHSISEFNRTEVVSDAAIADRDFRFKPLNEYGKVLVKPGDLLVISVSSQLTIVRDAFTGEELYRTPDVPDDLREAVEFAIAQRERIVAEQAMEPKSHEPVREVKLHPELASVPVRIR